MKKRTVTMAVIGLAILFGSGMILLAGEELVRNYIVEDLEKHVYHLPVFGVCDMLQTCLLIAIVGLGICGMAVLWALRCKKGDRPVPGAVASVGDGHV